MLYIELLKCGLLMSSLNFLQKWSPLNLISVLNEWLIINFFEQAKMNNFNKLIPELSYFGLIVRQFIIYLFFFFFLWSELVEFSTRQVNVVFYELARATSFNIHGLFELMSNWVVQAIYNDMWYVCLLKKTNYWIC